MPGDYITSGAIHFTGLGNGTDFDSIIEATIQTQSFHKNRLEHWKSGWEEKQEAFDELNTALVALQTHMRTMDRPDEFFEKSVATTDDDVLSAKAESSAGVGNHTILVDRLAQNKIQTCTTGYTDPDMPVNLTGSNQTIVLNYGSEAPVTVVVPNNTTLTGLVNMINKDPDNPGVRAAVVSDGNQHYLQLRGLDMGDDATLSLAGSTLAGYDDTAGNWDINQENQDSRIRVDGWPTSGWIESDSNTVDSALEGVSFTLKSIPLGQSNASVTISISNDDEAIKENVRGFVDKINEVRTMLIDMTKYDENLDRGSILTGNYGLQMISSMLKNVTSERGVGFDSDDDTVSTLSQIGIMTVAEEGDVNVGLLEFDEEVFEEAMKADSDGVAALFSAYFDATTNSPDFAYNSHISGVTQAGTYKVEYTVSGGVVTSATMGGRAASVSGTQITGAPGTDMAGLALDVLNLSDGTYSGEVRIKLGKAGQMDRILDEITDSHSGPLHILDENYQDIIDDIDEKIEYEENKLARMERTLRNQYARLEATLANYNNIQTSLQSQLTQLSS
ncbi:flagellar filament capping protein FliD [Desulfocurvus sp. DL9XJH121]